MSTCKNRWLPESRRIASARSGWRLADDEFWDEGVELFQIQLDPPDSISLGFTIGSGRTRILEFRGLVDVQIDGPLFMAQGGMGWDILDISMITGSPPRNDGRLVYFMELANAIICFASLPGRIQTPSVALDHASTPSPQR